MMHDLDKPRCIVLPFQDSKSPGAGLALQFLLSNVIAAHTAFKECWFGWRAGKIFQQPEHLRRYCAGGDVELDLQRLGAAQDVQCWVYGRVDSHAVDIEFFNTRAEIPRTRGKCPYSTKDHLVGFRECFFDLLDRSGFPLTRDRWPMALSPELIGWEGLRLAGQALEVFYCHSAFGDPPAIDPAPFVAAVQSSPDSFIALDLLGWAYYRKQLAAEAKDAFLKSLKLSPDATGPMAGLMGCAVLERDQNASLYWAARKAWTRGEDVAAAIEKAQKKFHP
jgi:hypothetical protein